MKEKFCIASVSSFKDINMASTNNSKTKQTFSFNKTPRFEKIQPVYMSDNVDVINLHMVGILSNIKLMELGLDMVADMILLKIVLLCLHVIRISGIQLLRKIN